MNGLEEAIVEKFDRDGKVAVWMERDDLSSILSYLFEHSSSIYVYGRYTIFKNLMKEVSNLECPRCGAEAHREVVEVVEGKGYVWEARCDECDWEDTKYEF